MSLNFYFHPISPPSRSARLLLLLSKTQYTEKLVDLMKKENTTPEYSLINPNQTVPALQEGNFNLFESHAIMRYIATSRKLTNFYPQDPQCRARIDAYLDFHINEMSCITSFPMDFYLKPVMMKVPVPTNKVERLSQVDETLKFFVHVFLQDGKCDYIGGQKQPSLADIRAIIDLSVLFLANFDFEKFPVLKTYIQRMFKIPEVTKAQIEFLQIVKQIQPQQNAFISSLLCAKPIQTETIVLYFNPISAPSRAVRALLILSKIDYTEKVIDVQSGQNKTPEFTKINPNETIPAIQQGSFCLFESHAILRYVADQYRLLSFYPKEDLKQKALIDAYLDFHHTGMKLISKFVFEFVFGPAMMKLQEPQNKEGRLKEVNETIDFFVKTFLCGGKHKYIMGNKTISIADLVAVSEISNLFAANYDFSQNQQFAKYIECIFENASIKQANKEFFGQLMQMPIQLNPFIKAIISSNKKKGCC